MSLENVQPESTLAIVLGASEWPLSPKLPKSKAFANSAKGFSIFLTAREGFNLPTKNLLNLFDAGDAPNEINSSISTFLIKRQEELQKAGTPAKDVIAYYVGHGGFTPGEQKYFLAVRTTQEDSEGASSIRMSDFARTLKQ